MEKRIVYTDQDVIDFINKVGFWFEDYDGRLPKEYPCWCIAHERESGVLPWTYIEYVSVRECNELLHTG